MRTYSHTALKRWQRCQLSWKYYYLDKLSPKERAKHFERGSDLHNLLELFYSDGDKFLVAYAEASEEDRDLISRYTTKWENEDHDWKVLAAEQEFHLQLGEHKVVYKPDLIVQIGDDVWVVDHKTSKNIPDEWNEFSMTDFQHLLYVAGVREIYPNTRGFIFNYMRTKPPTQPTLIKDKSRISAVRTIDTDYQTLYDFADKVGMLDHEDVKDKLNILRIAPDRYFQRHFLIAPDHAIAQCLADTEAVLDQMQAAEENGGPFPRHVLGAFAGSAACSNCDFQPLCHGDLLGANTDIIMLNYVKRPPR